MQTQTKLRLCTHIEYLRSLESARMSPQLAHGCNPATTQTQSQNVPRNAAIVAHATIAVPTDGALSCPENSEFARTAAENSRSAE